MKTFEQFVNEKFNLKKLSVNLDRPDDLKKNRLDLKISEENVNNFILDQKSKNYLAELTKQGFSFNIISFNNKCPYIQYAVNYFKDITDVNKLNPPIYLILCDKEAMSKISDEQKVSESSVKASQFIKYNLEGGASGKISLKTDNVQTAWLIHEIAHELYNKGLRGKCTPEIDKKFGEFINSDEEFQKSKNEELKNGYYSYPDGPDERVACYHQYDYLTSIGRTFEQVEPYLKDSYYTLWDNYRSTYFKKWFEFFKNNI